MAWIHNGRPLTELPPGVIGFLYLVIVPDGRLYVGQTMARRWNRYWGGGAELRRYYNKYGKHGVRRYVLMLFKDAAKLNRAEEHLITVTNAMESDHYFNNKEGGRNSGRVNEKTRRLMSRNRKGNKLTPEQRKRVGDAQRGKKRGPKPEHIKKRIAKTLTGRKKGPHTSEAKKKIGDGNRGKFVSPETRRKLSEKAKGRPGWNKGKEWPQNVRDKIGLGNRGEKAGHAKLKEGNVQSIHMDYAMGQDPRDIAKKYNMSFGAIYDIVKGRTWKHVKPIFTRIE